MIDTIPTQETNLALSVIAFSLATLAVYLSRRMNGHAPYSLRVALVGLWLATALRLYSASSFIWGPEANEHGWLPGLRLVVLVVLTLEVIVMGALVAYYWRRWRAD